jgi:hypothetical protein
LRPAQIVSTTRGVVHQIFGDKLIDDRVIACFHSAKELFDDFLRLPAGHPLILPGSHDQRPLMADLARCRCTAGVP